MSNRIYPLYDFQSTVSTTSTASTPNNNTYITSELVINIQTNLNESYDNNTNNQINYLNDNIV